MKNTKEGALWLVCKIRSSDARVALDCVYPVQIVQELALGQCLSEGALCPISLFSTACSIAFVVWLALGFGDQSALAELSVVKRSSVRAVEVSVATLPLGVNAGREQGSMADPRMVIPGSTFGKLRDLRGAVSCRLELYST